MQRFVAGITALAMLGWSGAAQAWGSQGHQMVGAIADQLLTANAHAHVAQDLGFSLQVAATWPDCARSVGQVKGKFVYKADPQFATWCKVFETKAGKARMVDYVQRNWRQCVDDDPGRACHAKYHFADVAVQHDHYQLGQVGTDDHDVPHAIAAAIARLEDKPVPAPFDIKDHKEALFLLAHFVGDIHQPLHVGAVYLDPATGALVDPDAVGGDISAFKTQGGNIIMNAGGNLHSEWDAILASLGTTPAPTLLDAARQVPVTSGDLHIWPEAWATDTVLASHQAFAGLAFGPQASFVVRQKPVKAWPVTGKPATYSQDQRTLQAAQLAKAGKRLADLLNTIWP